MTDNRTDSKSTQPQTSKKPVQPTNAERKIANPNTATTATAAKVPEPQIKKVDIVIAGVTYQIYCPIHEEEELRSAVYYINNFALDIKRKAPSLSQENMLVLSCLNLYEKISAYKKADENQHHKSEQADALLNKIMHDAKSIL